MLAWPMRPTAHLALTASLALASLLQRRQELLRGMTDGDAVLLIGGDLTVTVEQAQGLSGSSKSTHPFARVTVMEPFKGGAGREIGEGGGRHRRGEGRSRPAGHVKSLSAGEPCRLLGRTGLGWAGRGGAGRGLLEWDGVNGGQGLPPFNVLPCSLGLNVAHAAGPGWLVRIDPIVHD
jgi:hypothetical protein